MSAIVLGCGSLGAEVGNLQRFLLSLSYSGSDGRPLVVDESFGMKTEQALTNYQKTTGLRASGLFDAVTRLGSIALGFVPFVQARHCRILWPAKRDVKRIVIHTMECSESGLSAAENVAAWFAGPSSPVASAHYMIDRDSIVQGVRDTDEAWHASQANLSGIGIEHAGFAAQTASEWEDEASHAILCRSARLAARLCRLYQIPAMRLSEADIVAGRPGFCGHADVNHAYGNAGHTDPGKNFPWASYLAQVEENI